MATKPPGVLGTVTNPGQGPSRTTAGNGNFRSAPVAGSSTIADLEHRAKVLAHGVATAIGWNEKRSAAYRLVGHNSFTAGVVVGMGENLVQTVVAAVDLLQTLTLAEYWESRRDHSFMGQLRSNMWFAISPATSLAMGALGHFWPGFDQKAEKAYEERSAIAEAIKHAFTHPKEFLGTLTKSQETKAREFVALMAQESLAGNFHAGVLMGELLFDLLMVIDLAVGLAKLAMAVPKLARYAEDVARLAREFRVARQVEKAASELAPAGPRITPAEGANAGPGAGRGGSGGGSGAAPKPTPKPVADPPPPVLEEEAPAPVNEKPQWLKNIEAGNDFNKAQAPNYPYNEVYIDKPTGDGYYRLDSYDPDAGEIVSRKFTQLSEVQTDTATGYIDEIAKKYPVGATVAEVPSSGTLAGATLQGQYILEVPPQINPVPQAVLDAANNAGVLIRDSAGHVY